MPLGVFAVVGGVDMVLAEADRVGNLVGELIDADLDAEFREDAHDVGIEIGDGAREEPDLLLTAVARRRPQLMVEEIEIELERALPVRDRRGGQPARRHIKHHVPGMIEPGRL